MKRLVAIIAIALASAGCASDVGSGPSGQEGLCKQSRTTKFLGFIPVKKDTNLISCEGD